ncbi:hypothetical protein OAS39_07670 [Pirellulales bacterium]|nr:hypothetical protein [Pirellulales bacterium]
MTEIDQFESVFKSAGKTLFQHEDVSVEKVLVVSDGNKAGAAKFAANCRTFLAVFGGEVEWQAVDGSQFDGVGRLLQLVGQNGPDLICTHRYLHTQVREYPYSLGTYLDVLTQVSATPVVVMPHPESNPNANPHEDTDRVMAITDHFTGDNHLASRAAHITQSGGRLWLTHVEDEATLERYLATISKIPEIDTDIARKTLQAQLLKEPRDYIESCRVGLREAGVDVQVENVVVLGHHLRDYKKLIEAHGIDMLVLNTKDEGQLAMHGVAYSLTVELRNIPMLLL